MARGKESLAIQAGSGTLSRSRARPARGGRDAVRAEPMAGGGGVVGRAGRRTKEEREMEGTDGAAGGGREGRGPDREALRAGRQRLMSARELSEDAAGGGGRPRIRNGPFLKHLPVRGAVSGLGVLHPSLYSQDFHSLRTPLAEDAGGGGGGIPVF